LIILEKKKNTEAKSQRKDKNTLGVAHFSSQEKNNYLVWMPLGNFIDIKEKLLVI
jgi:hypothetical protein